MESFVEVLLELFLQFFFEVLADFIWSRLPESVRKVVKFLTLIAAAVLLGWLSRFVAPTPFIKSNWLSIAYLIAAPVLIGTVMECIGRAFEKWERPRARLQRFGSGWLFAFVFALTRYLCTR